MHLEKTNLPRLETLIKAYGAATIKVTKGFKGDNDILSYFMAS